MTEAAILQSYAARGICRETVGRGDDRVAGREGRRAEEVLARSRERARARIKGRIKARYARVSQRGSRIVQ